MHYVELYHIPAPCAPFLETRCGSTWQRDFGCERKDAAFDRGIRSATEATSGQETRCKTGMNWREHKLSLDHLHHVSYSISPTYFKIVGRQVLVDKSWQNNLCTTCPSSHFSELGVWYLEASSLLSLYPQKNPTESFQNKLHLLQIWQADF